MAASPEADSAVPSAMYGQFVPLTTSGRTRPTANPAAIAANPVRHHARYVRSCASSVRWTSPLAISGQRNELLSSVNHALVSKRSRSPTADAFAMGRREGTDESPKRCSSTVEMPAWRAAGSHDPDSEK